MNHYLRSRKRLRKMEWSEAALKLAVQLELTEEQRGRIRGSGKNGRIIQRDVRAFDQ